MHDAAAIPAAREAYEGRGPTRLANERGVEYQRAMQLSIPMVTPLLVLVWHREKQCAIDFNPVVTRPVLSNYQDGTHRKMLPWRDARRAVESDILQWQRR